MFYHGEYQHDLVLNIVYCSLQINIYPSLRCLASKADLCEADQAPVLYVSYLFLGIRRQEGYKPGYLSLRFSFC